MLFQNFPELQNDAVIKFGDKKQPLISKTAFYPYVKNNHLRSNISQQHVAFGRCDGG